MVGVNRAWGRSGMRSMIRSRLTALVLVTSFAIVLVLFTIVVTLLKLVAGLLLPFWQQILVILVPFVLQVLILYMLYRWGPTTARSPTHARAALLGALFTGLALEITTKIYTWYLQSGFASYEVIYGSLGAIIGLLFWVYMSSLILLFGAYLAETIQFRLQHGANMELPEFFQATVK